VNALSAGLTQALNKNWHQDIIRQSVAGYRWEDNAKALYDSFTHAEKGPINILYHHRTQGTGPEGVHISGIVNGFKDRVAMLRLFRLPVLTH